MRSLAVFVLMCVGGAALNNLAQNHPELVRGEVWKTIGAWRVIMTPPGEETSSVDATNVASSVEASLWPRTAPNWTAPPQQTAPTAADFGWPREQEAREVVEPVWRGTYAPPQTRLVWVNRN